MTNHRMLFINQSFLTALSCISYKSRWKSKEDNATWSSFYFRENSDYHQIDQGIYQSSLCFIYGPIITIISSHQHITQFTDYYSAITYSKTSLSSMSIELPISEQLSSFISSGRLSLQSLTVSLSSSSQTDWFKEFSSSLGRVDVEALSSTPKKCSSLFLVFTMSAGRLNFSTNPLIALRLIVFFSSPHSSWYCKSISFLVKMRFSHDCIHWTSCNSTYKLLADSPRVLCLTYLYFFGRVGALMMVLSPSMWGLWLGRGRGHAESQTFIYPFSNLISGCMLRQRLWRVERNSWQRVILIQCASSE